MRSASEGKGLDEITKSRRGPKTYPGKHFLHREGEEVGEADVPTRRGKSHGSLGRKGDQEKRRGLQCL